MQDSTISIRVRQIISERIDVKTFVFEKVDGTSLIYKAGQFLTFIVSVNGQEIRRSYSMSSAPEVDKYPSITVKRVQNGEMSRMWVDHTKVGDIFQCLNPSGRFVLDTSDSLRRDVVLIAAGSGITPIFSILKSVLIKEPQCHITLIFANRNQVNTLFSEQIEVLQRQNSDRLQVINIHSQPTDDWVGIRGRLNNSRLETILNKHLRYDQADARVFLCGPSELMRTLGITLRYLGFTDHQIRKENFVIEKVMPPLRYSEPHTIEIDWRGKVLNLEVHAHETILDAALRMNIQLPYSCRGGRCSTCTAICKRGDIYMSVNEVLTDRDLAEGWILTCSGYPESDDVKISIE